MTSPVLSTVSSLNPQLLQTENTLKQIQQRKDLSPEGKGKNWVSKSINLGLIGSFALGGIAAGNFMIPLLDQMNPWFDTPTPPLPYSVALILSGTTLLSQVSEEKQRFTKLGNELNQLAATHSQDKNPQIRTISEKLTAAAKTVNAYKESRNYIDYAISGTLIATGLMGRFDELQPIVFATGVVGTAALAAYQHFYKKQDLETVSKNVNECLQVIELQKKQVNS